MSLRKLSAWWCVRAAAVTGRLSLAVVLLLWAMLSLPNLGLRAFYFEEGRNAMHAMALIDSGSWYVDAVAGERFIQRLPLQPWLVRSFAAITGGINEWAVRLPALASVLGTVALVYGVTRRAGDAVAASFAAASFLTSVGVVQRLRLGEPDTAIMALSFAAFAVWGADVRGSRLGWGRWLACGVLMATVCGFKGPQPCAYFLASAGLFAVVRRRWGDLSGLVLATAFPVAVFAGWLLLTALPGDWAFWLAEMRLAGDVPAGSIVVDQALFAGQVLVEWLPPLLLAVPLWRRTLCEPKGDRDLPIALLLYAGVATLALVAWPGARARYALPALPAVAVAAGLGFHRFRAACPRLLALATTIGGGVAAYQLVLVIGVMTAWPDPFTKNRDAALAMIHVIRERPAPVQMISPGHNVAAYLGAGVRAVTPEVALHSSGAVWLFGIDTQIAALRQAHIRIEAPVSLPVVTEPAFVLARLAPG